MERRRFPGWLAALIIASGALITLLLVVMSVRLGVLQAVGMVTALLLLIVAFVLLNVLERSFFDRLLNGWPWWRRDDD
jgi:hypothetical protein